MLREMCMAIVLIILSNYYNIPPVVNATFDKIGLITVVQKKTPLPHKCYNFTHSRNSKHVS